MVSEPPQNFSILFRVFFIPTPSETRVESKPTPSSSMPTVKALDSSLLHSFMVPPPFGRIPWTMAFSTIGWSVRTGIKKSQASMSCSTLIFPALMLDSSSMKESACLTSSSKGIGSFFPTLLRFILKYVAKLEVVVSALLGSFSAISAMEANIL